MEKVIIVCNHCKEFIIMDSIVPAEIEVKCKTCKGHTKKKIDYKTIHCNKCDHIGQYVNDDRINYFCKKCNNPFHGFVANNIKTLIKTSKALLEQIPLKSVKENGYAFIVSLLEASPDLYDNDLKNILSYFQRMVSLTNKHLLKGKKNAGK